MLKQAKHAARVVRHMVRLLRPKPESLVGKEPVATFERIIKVPGYMNTWCGYYDHSPFQPQNPDVLLVHANNAAAWRVPNPKQKTDIILFNWKTQETIDKLGSTFSWNWQQGARAQWIADKFVAINTFDSYSDSYRAVLINTKTGSKEILPFPLQEADDNGNVYSISYRALQEVRPDYGYKNHRNRDVDFFSKAITRFNIHTRTLEEIVTVSALVDDAAARGSVGPISLPKINHVSSSSVPGTAVFLFRYFLNTKRVTDLYCIVGSSVKLLAGNCGASHFCWNDARSLLVSMSGENGFGYYLIDVPTGQKKLVRLYQDGHPQPFSSSHFIADTYPNRFGERELHLVPFCHNDVATLLYRRKEGLFFHGECRCDFHPSVSRDKRWIQVDVANGFKRAVAILSLKSHLN